jgi:predicted metalloprotease
LDETFFEEMKTKFGAKGGDVAEAYIIAHEVGHHVQALLGITQQVEQVRRYDNQASINLELQADCYAGIWASSIQWILEKDEILEAMDAASSAGDDRIQKKMTGEVNPESWTHGSSAQRKEWFERGYEYADFQKCNTFK